MSRRHCRDFQFRIPAQTRRSSRLSFRLRKERMSIGQHPARARMGRPKQRKVCTHESTGQHATEFGPLDRLSLRRRHRVAPGATTFNRRSLNKLRSRCQSKVSRLPHSGCKNKKRGSHAASASITSDPSSHFFVLKPDDFNFAWTPTLKGMIRNAAVPTALP